MPTNATTKAKPQTQEPPKIEAMTAVPNDQEPQRLRGGGVAKDCFMGALGCFFCFECCEGCCDCLGDIICCPCEMCC